jgi:hypothetical protein
MVGQLHFISSFYIGLLAILSFQYTWVVGGEEANDKACMNE